MTSLLNRLLPPDRRRARLRMLLATASVALLILTAHAATTRFDPRGQQASPSARAALMTRASALTAQVMSYRAASAENDIAAAKSLMTESMQADYDRTLPPLADRNKQVKSGIKVDARVSRLDGASMKKQKRCPQPACAVGIVSMTADEATVLVFVNQYATASSTKNTLLNPTWEIVRLVRQDGRWLIDGMEAP